MIRKVLRFFGWLAGGTLGGALLVYLVLVMINWRDVPPSEAAERFTLLNANRAAVADGQNGFVYLLGMAVVAGQEPLRAGIAMAERARSGGGKATAMGYDHPDYPQLDLIKERSSSVAALIDGCRTMEEACVALLHSPPQGVVKLSATDELLLQRYRTLIATAAWQDIPPQGYDGAIPSYNPAMSGQSLSLYDIWAHAESRGAKATLAMLDADARFWRNVLNSSQMIISSMVATNGLRRNLLWSNLVMQRLSGKGQAVEMPATWITPISDVERRMERAWAGEWAVSSDMLRSTRFSDLLERDGQSHLVSRLIGTLAEPLLLRQETINLAADDFAGLTSKLVIPYEQLPAAVDKVNSEEGQSYLSFPAILHNPIGKLLHEIARPAFSAYALRVPDLEGGRRALLAMLELRNNKTPRNKIAEALAASSYRNPYSNEPFQWDEATGSVVFEGLGEGKNRRYLFPY